MEILDCDVIWATKKLFFRKVIWITCNLKLIGPISVKNIQENNYNNLCNIIVVLPPSLTFISVFMDFHLKNTVVNFICILFLSFFWLLCNLRKGFSKFDYLSLLRTLLNIFYRNNLCTKHNQRQTTKFSLTCAKHAKFWQDFLFEAFSPRSLYDYPTANSFAFMTYQLPDIKHCVQHKCFFFACVSQALFLLYADIPFDIHKMCVRRIQKVHFLCIQRY